MLSEIRTVSVLVPRELMESLTEAVAPFAMDTSTIRDMTPIIMPSMVRNERILFPTTDFRDILKASKNIRQSPPLHGRPGY